MTNHINHEESQTLYEKKMEKNPDGNTLHKNNYVNMNIIFKGNSDNTSENTSSKDDDTGYKNSDVQNCTNMENRLNLKNLLTLESENNMNEGYDYEDTQVLSTEAIKRISNQIKSEHAHVSANAGENRLKNSHLESSVDCSDLSVINHKRNVNKCSASNGDSGGSCDKVFGSTSIPGNHSGGIGDGEKDGINPVDGCDEESVKKNFNGSFDGNNGERMSNPVNDFSHNDYEEKDTTLHVGKRAKISRNISEEGETYLILTEHNFEDAERSNKDRNLLFSNGEKGHQYCDQRRNDDKSYSKGDDDAASSVVSVSSKYIMDDEEDNHSNYGDAANEKKERKKIIGEKVFTDTNAYLEEGNMFTFSSLQNSKIDANSSDAIYMNNDEKESHPCDYYEKGIISSLGVNYFVQSDSVLCEDMPRTDGMIPHCSYDRGEDKNNNGELFLTVEKAVHNHDNVEKEGINDKVRLSEEKGSHVINETHEDNIVQEEDNPEKGSNGGTYKVNTSRHNYENYEHAGIHLDREEYPFEERSKVSDFKEHPSNVFMECVDKGKYNFNRNCKSDDAFCQEKRISDDLKEHIVDSGGNYDSMKEREETMISTHDDANDGIEETQMSAGNAELFFVNLENNSCSNDMELSYNGVVYMDDNNMDVSANGYVSTIGHAHNNNDDHDCVKEGKCFHSNEYENGDNLNDVSQSNTTNIIREDNKESFNVCANGEDAEEKGVNHMSTYAIAVNGKSSRRENDCVLVEDINLVNEKQEKCKSEQAEIELTNRNYHISKKRRNSFTHDEIQKERKLRIQVDAQEECNDNIMTVSYHEHMHNRPCMIKQEEHAKEANYEKCAKSLEKIKVNSNIDETSRISTPNAHSDNFFSSKENTTFTIDSQLNKNKPFLKCDIDDNSNLSKEEVHLDGLHTVNIRGGSSNNDITNGENDNEKGTREMSIVENDNVEYTEKHAIYIKGNTDQYEYAQNETNNATDDGKNSSDDNTEKKHLSNTDMSHKKKNKNENETLLPIANISRIMKRILPASAKVAKESKDIIRECVTEFIQFLTSEASDRCLRERRKTISGFNDYVEPLSEYLNKWKQLKGLNNSNGCNEKKFERMKSSEDQNTTANSNLNDVEVGNNIEGVSLHDNDLQNDELHNEEQLYTKDKYHFINNVFGNSSELFGNTFSNLYSNPSEEDNIGRI
ncbi:CCAAT-box DNA binding protein subunit B [Plasmodium ovale curtisi]|uniref:CCAAT-box DNA binding protein subunit B n=1 Tax=Plasmodium ovale curtisi TaxID=864141 RepID=A0A1A8WJC6_PLAOA|nr:CCAAT-box DNA binding protein subunit B [Plasmodium ovale curtisi]SBS92217.1 CCAAT-box DNA binding protein subunit B [Plasmodium ovale curtisi]